MIISKFKQPERVWQK